MASTHDRTARLALIIGEQRRDLGLSLSETARLAGVSRSTITKIEAGGPHLVVRVAGVLNTLELAGPPRDGALLYDLERSLGCLRASVVMLDMVVALSLW